MDGELTVALSDVWQACRIVCAAPAGELATVRDEAVMAVYTLLEQLALERAAGHAE